MERTIISQRVREAVLDLMSQDEELTEATAIGDLEKFPLAVHLLKRRLIAECTLSTRPGLIEIGKETTIGSLVDSLVALMEQEEDEGDHIPPRRE